MTKATPYIAELLAQKTLQTIRLQDIQTLAQSNGIHMNDQQLFEVHHAIRSIHIK